MRAIARHPDRLRGRAWYDDVELVAADAADLDQIREALDGTDVAYYLIHSLGSGRTFESTDRHTALTFAQAAREAGVGRIVYLGGLYPEGEDLSPHLASRTEVGEILLASGVPTTVLRAAVILGSGSASFEMMRYLTERLPAMTVAALGGEPHPAHRDPRRAALPGRLRGDARRREPRVRHRRPRRPHLPRHDAAVRGGGGPASADHRRGPGADAEAVLACGCRS